MSAEAAPEDDDSYHSLILGGRAMCDAGYAARRAEVFALRARGWRPPAIARELQRRARAAGCSEHQINHYLGVSVHNVRIILRDWPGRTACQVAIRDTPNV